MGDIKALTDQHLTPTIVFQNLAKQAQDYRHCVVILFDSISGDEPCSREIWGTAMNVQQLSFCRSILDSVVYRRVNNLPDDV